MSKQVSSLSVALFANVGNLVAGFQRGEQAAGSMLGKIGSLGSSLAAMTGVAAIAAVALHGISDIGKGFELAAQFETAQVQLTALTGSASIAHSLLGQLRDFAKSSPFEFPELEGAAKKLLSVGVGAGSITPLLKEVGEVAAGTGTDIDSIADIFARVAAEGGVSSRELKAFGREGIPIVQTLAQQFHTTAAGVEQLAANGTIGFTQLEKAFDAMTAKGGRFNGILEAQSHTLGGVWKSLRGTLEDQLANVGEAIANAFNVTGLVPKITALVEKVGTITERIVTISAPYVAKFVDLISSGLDWVMQEIQPFAQDVAGALAVVGFVFTHAGDIVDLVGFKIAAAMETIVNRVTYGIGAISTILANLPKLLSGDIAVGDLIKPRQIGDAEKQFQDLAAKASDNIGGGIQDAMVEAMKSVDGFFTALTKPDPITIPVGVDPLNQRVNIEPHLGKIVYAGSAEAQALRFAAQVSPAGGGAGMHLIPSAPQSAGTSPPASSTPYTPPGPSVSGVASNTADTASMAQLTELKTANQWLQKLELNTRGTTGTGAVVFKL